MTKAFRLELPNHFLKEMSNFFFYFKKAAEWFFEEVADEN